MASNSTKLITDMKSVISRGPQGTTAATAAGGTTVPGSGPIMDYVGLCQSVLVAFEEASVLIAKVITDTDSTDSANLSHLQGIQYLLNGAGTGGATSTALADIKACQTAGPNAASLLKCTAPGGPIMDWVGTVSVLRKKLEQCAIQIGFNSQASGAPKGSLLSVTDSSGDTTNRNLLLGMSQVLV
jgi:hypothetical protein